VDVTVADPLREGLIPEAAVERERAAREAAQAKAVKYGDHPADDIFIPLAVKTFGCLDSFFDEFLGTCARRAAELRMGGRDLAPMASMLLCLNICERLWGQRQGLLIHFVTVLGGARTGAKTPPIRTLPTIQLFITRSGREGNF
jgi:hypothetical protein